MPVTVGLLADAPGSIPAVAELRWREWGHPPEPTELSFWLDITTAEAGRDDLPVTMVAHDAEGSVLGAVGMDVYDLDERRDTSPWVTGLIVRAERRAEGVGRRLMAHLEGWAVEHGIGQAWAGTEFAAGFYATCGWTAIDAFVRGDGLEVTVLTKRFTAAG